MANFRFVADKESVVLVAAGESGISEAAPIRIDISNSRTSTDGDFHTFGTTALLDAESFAKSAARCLNAALTVDREDLDSASQALEILVAQQLAKVDADDPVVLAEESIRYVLHQERWKFDVEQEKRPDGVRLNVVNPNGAAVPLSVLVSLRGKTPSFWVMQDNRLVQGSHAYKIPIQAATALKAAIDDYIFSHDIGTIHPHG